MEENILKVALEISILFVQNTILALCLIALNVALLFFLNVSPEINIPVSRKTLTTILQFTIVIISIIVIANPGKYLFPSAASLPWFGLLAMRHFIYKILAADFEQDKNITKFIRRFFEIYIFPFFAFFISLYQCIYIFIWSHP